MNKNRKKPRTDSKFKSETKYVKQSQIISYNQSEAEVVFSKTSLTTICESIQILIQELYKRGYPVYDFDHKKKYVQGVKVIRNKVYFLAAEEVDHEAENESGEI